MVETRQPELVSMFEMSDSSHLTRSLCTPLGSMFGTSGSAHKILSMCTPWGAPSPAHHFVGGARAFDLKCLRTPKHWTLGTRSSRQLHSVPSRHSSPQRADSLSYSKAKKSLFQALSSLVS